METVRLRQFKTIVETGGLLKASELLGITGGGLSKSMKVLEDELGFKLFLQKGRGLELTIKGKLFYEKLPPILKSLEELVSLDKAETGHEAKPIRFASFEVFTTYFLSDFIQSEMDDLAAHLREAIPGEMEKLVADREADIAITYEPIPHKGVEFLKVTTIEMAIYTQKDSEISTRPFNKIPFAIPITPLEGAPSGVSGLDGWPDHIFERNIKYKVQMMETVLQLASKGSCATFIPRFIANYFNEQVKSSRSLINIPNPHKMKKVVRDVFIIIPKGSEENALIKKLARSLRRIGKVS